MHHNKNNLIKDLIIIILSVLLAVVLVKTGILKNLLVSTKSISFFGSLIAGAFFTSVFTAAPATAALGEIARFGSVFLTALFGGLGALLGDLVIFRFVKNRLREDFMFLIKKSSGERFKTIFHLKLFRRIVPFIGALIVASPLPDELGLAMMGLSKMKTSLFIPLSFLLNFFGILIIGLIAKAI